MIEVLEFLPEENGSVKGRIKILVNNSQVMDDIKLCKNDKNRWLSFPSKKVTIDGKDHWRPYVFYQPASLQKKFCEEILKVLDAHMGA